MAIARPLIGANQPVNTVRGWLVTLSPPNFFSRTFFCRVRCPSPLIKSMIKVNGRTSSSRRSLCPTLFAVCVCAADSPSGVRTGRATLGIPNLLEREKGLRTPAFFRRGGWTAASSGQQFPQRLHSSLALLRTPRPRRCGRRKLADYVLKRNHRGRIAPLHVSTWRKREQQPRHPQRFSWKTLSWLEDWERGERQGRWPEAFSSFRRPPHCTARTAAGPRSLLPRRAPSRGWPAYWEPPPLRAPRLRRSFGCVSKAYHVPSKLTFAIKQIVVDQADDCEVNLPAFCQCVCVGDEQCRACLVNLCLLALCPRACLHHGTPGPACVPAGLVPPPTLNCAGVPRKPRSARLPRVSLRGPPRSGQVCWSGAARRGAVRCAKGRGVGVRGSRAACLPCVFCLHVSVGVPVATSRTTLLTFVPC